MVLRHFTKNPVTTKKGPKLKSLLKPQKWLTMVNITYDYITEINPPYKMLRNTGTHLIKL